MKALLKLIKVINYLILAFVWVFMVFNFNSLPETIPTHFGLDNKADAYGSRNSLLILPVVTTALFLLLAYVAKNPYSPLLNVPDSMRKDPMETEFFVLVIQFFMVVLFGSLIHEVFRVTLSGGDEMSNRTFIILGLMFLFIIGMVLRSNLKKSSAS
ncbi:MAG: DUF1648 domain-containing protein [Weeksellaceae bacterium]|nr:DUF1648 domain-containing protein [Weeksellaceae bacterium]